MDSHTQKKIKIVKTSQIFFSRFEGTRGGKKQIFSTLEQIRQKIGIYKATVVGTQQKILSKPHQPHSKTTVWRKFEIDRQNNQENQQRVLGQGKNISR